MIKILLVSDPIILNGLVPEATVEAEYGDECIEGSICTLAHHGSRSANPAPCNTSNVPILPDGSNIVVSHLDLDAIGGVLALLGKKPIDDEFWKGAEYVDVKGPQHILDLSEEVQNQLNAFYAYQDSIEHSDSKSKEPYIKDVTEYISNYIDIINAICDRTNKNHDNLIEQGYKYKESISIRVENCLIAEDEYVRVFKTAKEFCSGAYWSKRYNKICPATVVYNTECKTVTIAFYDAEKSNVVAYKILQSLWGPKAGGHAGIAGSPRNKEMTWQDAMDAIYAVEEALKVDKSKYLVTKSLSYIE